MSTAAQVAFNNGDAVTVRTGNPPTHYRTPVYVQGKTGRVVASAASSPTPNPWPTVAAASLTTPLPRRVPQTDLWDNYNGPATDRLQIDIYEQWLERAA